MDSPALEAVADGELHLATGERGGGLLEERGAYGANVAGEVGVVEDIEGGDPGREKFCVVAGFFGETEVMAVEEVERRYATGLESVAVHARGAGVAEAGVVVVVSGGFVVGCAGVEGGVDAEREPVVGVDVSD